MTYPSSTYPKTYGHIKTLIENSVPDIVLHDDTILHMLWEEDCKDGINWDSVIEGVELAANEDKLKKSMFGEGKSFVYCGAVFFQSVRKEMTTIINHMIEDVKNG